MDLKTDLTCECGHKWDEELSFDVERRWEAMGADGLFANAITICPKCEYKGVARGIIPEGDLNPNFYLKRKNSLYFPRGGYRPALNKKSQTFLNPSQELRVHVYREPSSPTLNPESIANYLSGKLDNLTVDIRRPFFNHDGLFDANFRKEMEKARIYDFSNPDFEPSSIKPKEPLISEGVVYDGFKLLPAAQQLLTEEELGAHHMHLIFTNCFFATWDGKDHRYHLRLSSLGFPKIISTTGIIEAPARPYSFYRQKHNNEREASDKQISDQFLSYNDHRLTEALKGISMQALFYHFIGEPFCVNPGCRLFNGHWQEEIIEAQLNDPEFCSAHRQVLERINRERKLSVR